MSSLLMNFFRVSSMSVNAVSELIEDTGISICT